MTRCIVARYTDTTNPDDQRFLYGPSEPTSHVGFVSSDLHWVKDIKNLVRLDISCNYIRQLDLSPLEGCETLKYLDLSENAIERVNLSPLKNCDKLVTLDLSYNRIEDVSLTPLVNCKSLRYIYLHRNQLNTINIAPINHLRNLQQVIIDNMKSRTPVPVFQADYRNNPPNLNDVLYAMTFKTTRPEWLEGCPEVKIIKLQAESYLNHVKNHGWESVRKHLEAAWPLVSPKQDYFAQKAILRDLGLPELACYDGSISDIIDIFPTSGSYEEGVEEIEANLISLLQEQLENGGSTLFFDIDKLATTPGSVLVPLIVSQREKELKKVILYQYGGRVNLMPLWLTGFGYSILEAVACGYEEIPAKIPDILERTASEIGISIPLKSTTSKKKYSSLGSKVSKPLVEHIYHLVPKTTP
ncbi:MAG: hypothetical protein RTV31_09685 [Candidatus Thorarchaeota archaeon]